MRERERTRGYFGSVCKDGAEKTWDGAETANFCKHGAFETLFVQLYQKNGAGLAFIPPFFPSIERARMKWPIEENPAGSAVLHVLNGAIKKALLN